MQEECICHQGGGQRWGGDGELVATNHLFPSVEKVPRANYTNQEKKKGPNVFKSTAFHLQKFYLIHVYGIWTWML